MPTILFFFNSKFIFFNTAFSISQYPVKSIKLTNKSDLGTWSEAKNKN
jgi:hypothetical protein